MSYAAVVFFGLLTVVSAHAQETPAPTPTPTPAAEVPVQAAPAPATTMSSTSAVATSSNEYKVKLLQNESRLLFGLYGQMSQFNRQGEALMGSNLEGIANYALTDKLAAQLSLAQSLDMANGLTVLFTGIRVGPAYAFIGDFIRRSSNLSVNGQETLAVPSVDTPMGVVDIGIDQYLFNGTDRIVPATGVSLGGRYDRTMWNFRVSAMLRYGALVISEDPVSMMTAGVGVLLRY